MSRRAIGASRSRIDPSRSRVTGEWMASPSRFASRSQKSVRRMPSNRRAATRSSHARKPSQIRSRRSVASRKSVAGSRAATASKGKFLPPVVQVSESDIGNTAKDSLTSTQKRAAKQLSTARDGKFTLLLLMVRDILCLGCDSLLLDYGYFTESRFRSFVLHWALDFGFGKNTFKKI